MMHCGIVLLAVCVHLIRAGPVPYHGAVEQHQNVPRFLNMTALEPSKTDVATSSLIQTSSESLISSPTSTHDSTTDALLSITSSQLAPSTSSTHATSAVLKSSVSSSQTDTQGHTQVASVSDVETLGITSSSESTGSSATFDISITSSETRQSSTTATSSSLSLADTLSSSTSLSLQASTSTTEVNSQETTNSVPQLQTQIPSMAAQILGGSTKSQSSAAQALTINPVGPSDASISVSSTTSITDSSSQPPLTVSSARSTPPTDQQIVSSSANALAAAATTSADASAFSTLASASAAGTTKSVPAKFPTAENGNLAMANGYNKVFQTLNQTSTCDPKDNSVATACIDGQPATCEVDGTYTLESCPQGQSCFAVPNSGDQSPISVGCYVPSDAAAKLAASSQSVSSTVSNTLNGVGSATSQPTTTASLNTEAAQAIETPSSTAALSEAAAQSSQAQITKAETTSLQLPPPESVQFLPSNSAQVTSSTTAIDDTQPEAASTQPASPTVTQSDENFQGPSPTFELFPPSDSQSAASETASAEVSTTIRHEPASSSAGLVLSFPSDLPSSGPASTTQTSQASATTNPAPVAEQKDAFPTTESSPSIEPQAGPSSSATPSQAPIEGLNNGILANNPPTATPSSASSPTTSASAGGITIVPEPNSSGEPTVTVTVTMTVHDRN